MSRPKTDGKPNKAGGKQVARIISFGTAKVARLGKMSVLPCPAFVVLP